MGNAIVTQDSPVVIVPLLQHVQTTAVSSGFATRKGVYVSLGLEEKIVQRTSSLA